MGEKIEDLAKSLQEISVGNNVSAYFLGKAILGDDDTPKCAKCKTKIKIEYKYSICKKCGWEEKW